MFHLRNENSSQLKEILSLWEDVIYYERAIIILFSGDPFFNIISYSKHSMPCQVSLALSLPNSRSVCSAIISFLVQKVKSRPPL